MAHYGCIRGAVSTAAPAGSIFITMYQIWHRRGASSGTGTRNLLKYFYWRTASTKRDWIREPGFDFSTAGYGGPSSQFVEQFRGDCKTAEMFLWLCGCHEFYRNLGGQSWPLPGNRNELPYGFPDELAAR